MRPDGKMCIKKNLYAKYCHARFCKISYEILQKGNIFQTARTRISKVYMHMFSSQLSLLTLWFVILRQKPCAIPTGKIVLHIF
jgi:hypothetical protein